jgi:hypothetical protein
MNQGAGNAPDIVVFDLLMRISLRRAMPPMSVDTESRARIFSIVVTRLVGGLSIAQRRASSAKSRGVTRTHF